MMNDPARRAPGRRVAIFTDEIGWHTTRLQAALRRRGALGRCVDLADCRFDTTWSPHGLVIPGFGRDVPEAAIVRGIAGGTFEQVTVRLGVLHALRELGVPVYNDARAIERSVDKSMTSFLLQRAGIPTPPAWTTESTAQARRLVVRAAADGAALVIKPLFGAQGKGLRRIGKIGRRFVGLPRLRGYGELAYLQRFVTTPSAPDFDWRVMVVGGRAVTAMRRVSRHWIHNVARGARCEALGLDGSMRPVAELAERAARALGLDYAGVDLLPSDVPGVPAWVIEVNGVAAWRGLQSVSAIDIADCIVADLFERRCAAPASRAA